LFNPGKIISDGRYKIDKHLRWGAGYEFETAVRAEARVRAARDESFIANLEQCNGCGGCTKQTPTMCPTYLATGEEIMSTRGRANASAPRWNCARGRPVAHGGIGIRGVEQLPFVPRLHHECPSNVNLPLLKAELLHAQIQKLGMNGRQRLVTSVDLLGALGCKLPRLTNLFFKSQNRPLHFWKSFRTHAGTGRAGIRPRPFRPLVCAARTQQPSGARGSVILWDDTFARYHEPHIGIAAVAVLEAAGFAVNLPKQRRCCGRPAFSQGHLDEAAKFGRHNLSLLLAGADAPIIFLEPSCYSMFAEDYRELKLPGAEASPRAVFVRGFHRRQLLQREPRALKFHRDFERARLVIHAHCHAKSLGNTNYMQRLAERLPAAPSRCSTPAAAAWPARSA
jgi:Fe-S oxidoreductase